MHTYDDSENRLNNPDRTLHPCFNEGAKGTYARVHLPVAAKCNVQCRFCSRKFSCVNESRPGVTSAVLSPAQALLYLERSMELIGNVSVAGIAGPGDACANPDETIETLELVRAKYPDLLLCLATNGLALFPMVDAFADLKVSHVTVTVNAVEPSVGSQIYSWVLDGKRRLRGLEAYEKIFTQQKLGIMKLKEYGITVKINSIVIPGVNDSHIVSIAKTVREWGADFFNAIPLLPVDGTDFGTIASPSHALINEIRNEASEFIPQMRHCSRCRSDAAGLLGEKEIGGVSAILKEISLMPLKPEEYRPYTAVATREDVLVNMHLGEAQEFSIYKVETDGSYSFVEKRETPFKGLGVERWIQLKNILGDCRAVLVSGVGEYPKAVLSDAGIKIIELDGLIEDGLDAVYKGTPVAPRSKPLSCGSGCSGGGGGCGA